MIQFRCWYCNKQYAVAEERVGERLSCTCKQSLRVPRRTGGNSRARTVIDWIVEAAVYGGGGALLGLGLALLLASQAPAFVPFKRSWILLAGLVVVGFLIGLVGGERGINWIGRMIRDREDG
jgi:hypothetical protein